MTALQTHTTYGEDFSTPEYHLSLVENSAASDRSVRLESWKNRFRRGVTFAAELLVEANVLYAHERVIGLQEEAPTQSIEPLIPSVPRDEELKKIRMYKLRTLRILTDEEQANRDEARRSGAFVKHGHRDPDAIPVIGNPIRFLGADDFIGALVNAANGTMPLIGTADNRPTNRPILHSELNSDMMREACDILGVTPREVLASLNVGFFSHQHVLGVREMNTVDDYINWIVASHTPNEERATFPKIALTVFGIRKAIVSSKARLAPLFRAVAA